jgi:hypothetical protein
MDFRVPDTLNSNETVASDDSVDVEFSEFTEALPNDSVTAADLQDMEFAAAPKDAPDLAALPSFGDDPGSEPAIDPRSVPKPDSPQLPLLPGATTSPPAWFRSARKIQVDDSGAQFRLTIKRGDETADGSAILAKSMTFTRPDGSTFQRYAKFHTDGSDGVICYTTVAGDLDTAGEWSVQAQVDLGDTDFRSELHCFVVHEAATALPPLPADETETVPPDLSDSPKTISRRQALLEERRRRRKAAVNLGLDDEEETEESPKDWKEWLVRWLTGKEARSIVTSFAFHAVLLLCMSLILFTQIGDNEAISMIMGQENALPTFEEVDMTFETTGGEATKAPQLQKVQQESAESILQSDFNEMFNPPGTGKGTGGGEGFDFAFKMPTGGKAVTKGSFTAWTVPKDPKPGQDYKIVIQIKVPETVKRYRIADLSGRVIGTDKYTLDIPYENQFNRYGTKIQKSLRSDKLEFVKRGDYARIVDSQVQVIVNVEGAKQLVQDTIEVKSRMLKEEQKLEIVF